MNKKLLGLFLGACFCAIFCGCGNVKIDSGTITGQPSLAVEELGSDIAAGEKPETVDSYEELKNGVNKFAFDLYDALQKDSNCFFSPYSI